MKFKEKTGEAIALSEEKVQISQRITRLMDNAITRLSAKIDEFGDERKAIEESQAELAKSAELRNSKKKQKEEAPVADATASNASTAVSEETQTYCTCGKVSAFALSYLQPSYGEMIGCDNDNCTIKWFHLRCVGLDSIPEGTWYCPICRPLMEKQKA